MHIIPRQPSKIKIIFCFAKPGKSSLNLNAKREQSFRLLIADTEPRGLPMESSKLFEGASGTLPAAQSA